MKARQLAHRTLAIRLTTEQTAQPAAPDAPELPIIGYPIAGYPIPPLDPNATHRRKHARKRARKRRFPGIKLVMMRDYVEELRACAEVTGWSFQGFLYAALLEKKRQIERSLGLPDGGLTKLSQRDRRELGGHFSEVCYACFAKTNLSDYYNPNPVRMPPLVDRRTLVGARN